MAAVAAFAHKVNCKRKMVSCREKEPGPNTSWRELHPVGSKNSAHKCHCSQIPRFPKQVGQSRPSCESQTLYESFPMPRWLSTSGMLPKWSRFTNGQPLPIIKKKRVACFYCYWVRVLSQACPSKVKHPHGHSSTAWSHRCREESTRKRQNTMGTRFAWTFLQYIGFTGFPAHIVVNLNTAIYLRRVNTMAQRGWQSAHILSPGDGSFERGKNL